MEEWGSWKVGRMEGWRIGGLEDWRIGGLEDWLGIPPGGHYSLLIAQSLHTLLLTPPPHWL